MALIRKLRKKELKRMQKKYGVNPQLNDQERQGLNIYKDRAEERRKEQGSDNPFEATQSSSLDVAIDESNKGFKMLYF